MAELEEESKFQEDLRKTETQNLEDQALTTFEEKRKEMVIDFNNVAEDDSLADAMKANIGMKTKKMLLRYKRLKMECERKDPIFTQKVLRNYFTLIRKVGSVYKRGGKLVASWQQRFVVLTNAGLVYFKIDEMKKEEDLEPQNFKPLNDFAI